MHKREAQIQSGSPSPQEVRAQVTLLTSARYQEAMALARTLTSRYPFHALGWKALGQALGMVGQIEDSIAVLRKAAALPPSDAEVHVNLGAALKSTGRLEEAEFSYRQALKIQPNLAEAHSNLGNTLLELGRVGEAEACYRKAIANKPNLAAAHCHLGNILCDSGRMAEGETSYRSALKINPDYVVANFNLGCLLKDLGRLEEAESIFRRVLRIKPGLDKAHNNLGCVLREFGRFSEAEIVFREAIAANPSSSDAYTNLAETLKDLGRFEEAEATFHSALQIAPDFAKAHCGLSLVLLRLGKSDAALVHFKFALNLAPEDSPAKIAFCTALYMFSANNDEKAKLLATKLRDSYPNDQTLLRGMAGILGDSTIFSDEDSYVRQVFDDFATTFESKLKSLDYDIPKLIADELGLESVIGGQGLDVLDAGCGTGLCGIYLKPIARNLVGVDLSSRMLSIARNKNVYDKLIAANLVQYLRENRNAFDLIVSADVLVYIKNVGELVEHFFTSLRPNGVVAISAESGKVESLGNNFVLQANGRYAHSATYLRNLFVDNGFFVQKVTKCTVRTELGAPVAGFILIAKREGLPP